MIVPTADGTPWAAPVNAAGTGVALSPFHIAALTFQRARQLKNGARPRVESAAHRPTRLALLEVLSDTISWSVSEAPPPPGEQPRYDSTPSSVAADQPRRAEPAGARSALLALGV